MTFRKIELLAPAKNAETGIAAVRFGADAVYIGPEKFGARKAAGNSTGDIEKLALYAHKFNARVYATLNTILINHELEEARKLIIDLYNAGVDAIIAQDMAILEMDIPPVAIHLSTQADNYDIERIRFLAGTGVKRIVLARELSIEQIKKIRSEVSCELEFFVHGALCVSFSGRCWMSAAAGGRSANRGECAQPCRKEWDLLDETGKVLSHGHLLSTRDLNHSANITELIDAGINSFKIEGRLKDIHYVKNITAHYRRTIDRILEGRPWIRKASYGTVSYDFKPDPGKTFNRGYTEYFLHGRTGSVSSYNTPKFTGERIGAVTSVAKNFFTASFDQPVHNGDGLTFTGAGGELTGIRVNRTEGDKIFPFEMNGIYAGAVLYRNHDEMFEKKLDSSRTERRLGVDINLSFSEGTLTLTLACEEWTIASACVSTEPEQARSAGDPRQAIEHHLKKLGDTIFFPRNVHIHTGEDIFIRPGVLNDLRRRAVAALEEKLRESYSFTREQISPADHPYMRDEIGPDHNVSNDLARRFYERHGVKRISEAFECTRPPVDFPLMTTKLCLRYETGMCPVYQAAGKKDKALYLSDGRKKYRLAFNCGQCVMHVYETPDD